MKNENILNEKDALYDILTGEKNLVKLYGSAMTEACGKDVRKAVKSNMLKPRKSSTAFLKRCRKTGITKCSPPTKPLSTKR